VTIEGFKITAANDNVINTDKNLHNIRLIDLSMYKGSVPGNDVLSNGLINVNSGTSMQILNSDFAWNKSIVVENRGHLLIHSSTFSDNKIKTQGVTVSIYNHFHFSPRAIILTGIFFVPRVVLCLIMALVM
jgi:hypothetical protein